MKGGTKEGLLEGGGVRDSGDISVRIAWSLLGRTDSVSLVDYLG